MLVETLKTRPLGVRTDDGRDAPTVPGVVFINPAWGQLGAQIHSAEWPGDRPGISEFSSGAPRHMEIPASNRGEADAAIGTVAWKIRQMTASAANGARNSRNTRRNPEPICLVGTAIMFRF